MADSFNYTFVGSGLDAALTFTGTSNGNGSYTITNVAEHFPRERHYFSCCRRHGPCLQPKWSQWFQYCRILRVRQSALPNPSAALDFSGVLLDVNGLFINIYGVGNGYEWADTGSYTNPSNS